MLLASFLFCISSQHTIFSLLYSIQALATLSSSSSSSTAPVSKCYLFGLGARWGIGHSTGLLLVGGIFILKDILQNNDDPSNNDSKKPIEIPEVVTRLFESFVGIFMLLLGIYGICEAKKIGNGYSSVNMDSDSDGGIEYSIAEDSSNNIDDGIIAADPNATSLRRRYSDDAFGDEEGIAHFEVDENSDSGCQPPENNSDSEGFEIDDLDEFRYNVQVMLGTVSTGEDNTTGEARNDHHHHHHSNSPFLALCAGIFHGLAGPGGVLGVVPAIQLHNAGLAACYLLSFCASSTVTMGTFAAVYGSVTAWLARCCAKAQNNASNVSSDDESANNNINATADDAAVMVVEFWIRCFSASLSLVVGVVWLVLLAMGKLEDVFG